MDDLDRRLLAMVSAHSFVTANQVGRYLAVEPAEVALRVDRLCAVRSLRRERLTALADPVLRVTPTGLGAIGSRLEAPGFAPVDVRHGLAAVAMWMAGWSGALGVPGRVLSRRELEGLDRAAAGSAGVATGFRVQVAGVDRYPDLALLPPSRHRIVVDVLLWPQRAFDPDELCVAYRDQLDFDAVLVIVDQGGQARVRASAVRAGITDRVFIRGAMTGAKAPAPVS